MLFRKFFLGELRRYVTCKTLEFNFLKIINIIFRRLRNGGYKKPFLKRLFRYVKYSSRNTLLETSQYLVHEEKFYETGSVSRLLQNSESEGNVLNSDSNTIILSEPIINSKTVEVCFYFSVVCRGKTKQKQ